MSSSSPFADTVKFILLVLFIILVCSLPLCVQWYFINSFRSNRQLLLQLQLQGHNRNRRRNSIVFNVDSGDTLTPSQGLDPSVLNSIPVFVFTEGVVAADCVICLSEFEVGEKGRSLPQCHHSFHIDCIGMWFTSHSTCPSCRAPVELITEDATSDEENLVVVFDSESQAESALTSNPVSDGSPADTMELKDFSIEVPSSELTESDGFRSPTRRMMLMQRISNRGLSLSSPSTVEVCGGDESCDLEAGREEPCLEPSRTQTMTS